MSQFGTDASDSLSANDDSSFQKEIACMMHGFGDNPAPNPASVALIENIVLQQMRGMLHEAQKTSELRHSKTISNVDVVYLLRNNKMKLKRFSDYQEKVSQAKRSKAQSNPDTALPEACVDEDGGQASFHYGGRKTMNEVVTNLDNTGELRLIDFDENKYRREIRAAKLSETMPLAKYEAYFKARTVSFGRSGFSNQKLQKFKNWVNPNNELTISVSAFDALSYLAFETIAEIVDIAFLIRQDGKRKADDPFSKFGAANLCNPVSVSNAVYIKSGHEGVPPISVAEIREVLRRVYTPRTGVAGLFYRNMRSELPPKFIAI